MTKSANMIKKYVLSNARKDAVIQALSGLPGVTFSVERSADYPEYTTIYGHRTVLCRDREWNLVSGYCSTMVVFFRFDDIEDATLHIDTASDMDMDLFHSCIHTAIVNNPTLDEVLGIIKAL